MLRRCLSSFFCCTTPASPQPIVFNARHPEAYDENRGRLREIKEVSKEDSEVPKKAESKEFSQADSQASVVIPVPITSPGAVALSLRFTSFGVENNHHAMPLPGEVTEQNDPRSSI